MSDPQVGIVLPCPESPVQRRTAYGAFRAGLAAAGFLAGVGLAASFALAHRAPGSLLSRARSLISPVEQTGRAGPWGRLVFQEVQLEPPWDVVRAEHCSAQASPWLLPGFGSDQLIALFQRAGLSDEQRAAFARSAACQGGEHPACLVRPSLDLLRGLSSASRAVLYHTLAGDPVNGDQFGSFHRRPADFDRWLASAGLRPAVQERIRALRYRIGDFMYFADLPTLCAELDGEDRAAVVRAVARTPTLIARLQVPRGAPVDELVAYWGRGGRERDVRPLLASLARDGGTVDVSHLLPPFAREHLYSYPAPGGPARDCHWTAMNFFVTRSEELVPLEAETSMLLRRDYRPVQAADARLGDVVVFLHPRGVIVHSMVYIADGVVFTKNGVSPHRPWVLSPLSTMREEYSTGQGLYELYFRKR